MTAWTIGALSAYCQTADVSSCISMTIYPNTLQPAVEPGIEIIVVLTNSCDETQIVISDTDMYRVMMIDTAGGILISPNYRDSSVPRPRWSGGRARLPIQPHGSLTQFLNLSTEVKSAIPPGEYWVVVSRKTKTWEHIITAQPLKIRVE